MRGTVGIAIKESNYDTYLGHEKCQSGDTDN